MLPSRCLPVREKHLGSPTPFFFLLLFESLDFRGDFPYGNVGQMGVVSCRARCFVGLDRSASHLFVAQADLDAMFSSLVLLLSHLLVSHSTSPQRGNCRPIRFEPPMLDFHEQWVVCFYGLAPLTNAITVETHMQEGFYFSLIYYWTHSVSRATAQSEKHFRYLWNLLFKTTYSLGPAAAGSLWPGWLAHIPLRCTPIQCAAPLSSLAVNTWTWYPKQWKPRQNLNCLALNWTPPFHLQDVCFFLFVLLILPH